MVVIKKENAKYIGVKKEIVLFSRILNEFHEEFKRLIISLKSIKK